MLRLVLRKIMFSKVVVAGYLVVGLVAANSRHYFAHLSGAKPVLSAAAAVLLWPLGLLGVNLHIR